jgi:integrase
MTSTWTAERRGPSTLDSKCRAILEEIKAERRCGAAIPNVNGFIFTNPDGSQTTKGQSEYQVGLALKETGVKKFTFPNYRDTTLTRSARQGINVDVAMKASGTRAFKWTNAMLIFNRTISQRPSARQNN